MGKDKAVESRTKGADEAREEDPEATPLKAGADVDWEKERVKRLEALLLSLEGKLTGEGFKASVGDYIRLLQIRKEIEDTRPREITVQWVEPSEEERAPAT